MRRRFRKTGVDGLLVPDTREPAAKEIKVSETDAGDVDFVKRAAQACPHESRLMIDSNQTWDLEHAQRMLDRLAKWGGITGAYRLAQSLSNVLVLWPHFMDTGLGQETALSIAAVIGETSVCEIEVNESRLRTAL